MSNIIERINMEQMRQDHPEFRPGDSVKVHIRIIEGGKERVQIFQGVVIRRKRGTMNATYTVRKISHGVGVEKTFQCTIRVSRKSKLCPAVVCVGPVSFISGPEPVKQHVFANAVCHARVKQLPFRSFHPIAFRSYAL